MVFGTEEIEFEHDGEVEIGGQDVGDRPDDPDVDTEVDINSSISGGVGKWAKLVYNVSVKDDIFLGSESDGNEWIDPVLESLKISYNGLSGDTERVEMKASSDDGALVFMNNEKREVRVEFFTQDDANVYLGDDDDELLLVETAYVLNPTVGNVTAGFQDVRGDGTLWKNLNTIVLNGSTNLADLEETKLFVVTQGQSIHIVTVQDIDAGDNELDFDDETYGRDYDDEDPSTNVLVYNGAQMAFDLGSLGVIQLGLWDNANMTALGWAAGVALRANDIRLADAANTTMNQYTARATQYGNGGETWGESIITLNEVADPSDAAGERRDVNVSFLETNDVTDIAVADVALIITQVDVDTGDDEVIYRTPVARNTSNLDVLSGSGFQDESQDNDDDRYAMTRAGSLLHTKEDSEDTGQIEDVDLDLVVNEARYGLAYVAEVPVVILAGGAGGSSPTRIEVGATVLDRNAAKVGEENLIVVGGPCVNVVAAELMGNPADCTEGFEAGKAMIKLYERNGKVALLVAGYAAEDTTRAARFLAQFDMNADKLKGTELEVGLTTVTKVA